MNITPTRNEVLQAYDLIKQCIDWYIEKQDIKFISSNIAPNTYKGMRQYRDDFGQFLVYNGGDHGLLGQEYNIKFRALHDSMHYAHELSFKFEDEKTLSDITARQFALIAYYHFDATHYEIALIKRVINAEIKGQIEYYEKHGTYVKDQSKFILERLGVEL